MSATVLRTAGLTKTYKDLWGRPKVKALHPLDLQVEAGEVFGLLGPNGSGKTTTIKLLLGLLQPSGGEAFVFDRDPGDHEAKHRLGYLPEETYLYKFLDADETLRFYGRLFGLGGKALDQRINDLVEQVGLAPARERRLGEYSKGMARRLGLAQALINDPDLVILDEPTSGLDPIGTGEVKELILRLKEAGKTVLLCSHLLADVEDVCDRIAILYKGRLREVGPVDELLQTGDDTELVLAGHDEGQIAGIRELAGDQLKTVRRPREKLDAHFRRIIAESDAADAAEAQASGATPAR
jgi:ABC-2 type transport system ATP-binding protein